MEAHDREPALGARSFTGAIGSRPYRLSYSVRRLALAGSPHGPAYARSMPISQDSTPRLPALTLLALEPLRAGLDYCASLLGSGPPNRGDGHPVLVLPGLAAGDWSTLHMRRVLRGAGFDAHGWGLGLNRGPQGDFDHWLTRVEDKLHALVEHSGGRKVSVVGWSLGGIYARELAKRAPQAVRQVITLGSPFAGIEASRVGPVFKLVNAGRSKLTPELEERLREDPAVPTTAIYSKTDGVVAWQACMANETAHCESIEVSRASHCGMGAHPRVLQIVADRLAQPEGRWQRWRAPMHGRAKAATR